MKKRIWEIDALRGFFILCMVLVHLIYDLQTFLHLPVFTDSFLFDLILNWGGSLFFLLSGICVTLGSRPVRRGLVVLGCAAVVSAVTYGLYILDFAGKSMIIYFGVLHCLGVCMLLWPLFRRMPLWLIGALCLPMILFGIYLDPLRFDCSMWLIPIGFKPYSFASSDYFALLPFLGFFLLGSVVGKTLYARKETLFPRVNPQNPLIRFFTAMGKWSLPIYMLHQPVLTGITSLLEVIL